MMLNNTITFRPAALILVVFVLGACVSQGMPVIRLQGDLTKIEKVIIELSFSAFNGAHVKNHHSCATN